MEWGGVGWGGVGWGGVGWRLGARAQREWDEDAKYLMMNEAPVLAQLRMERSQREALLPPARPHAAVPLAPLGRRCGKRQAYDAQRRDLLRAAS